MTPAEQVAAARAEIARRRWECRADRWLLGVFADADATLDRHTPIGHSSFPCCEQCSFLRPAVVWPCPDALAVINRYAPQP